MTETNPQAPRTATATVLGRKMLVQEIKGSQLMLLARAARDLRRITGTPDQEARDRLIKTAARAMDILETMVISEEDRDFLLDMTASGKLDLPDLLGIIEAFNEEEEQEQPPAKPVVRRGRPPKRV